MTPPLYSQSMKPPFRRPCLCGALAGAFFAAVLAGAGAAEPTRRVKFVRGKRSATLKGAVVRGDRDRYLLGASAGQTMTVRLTSLEKNAAFTLLRPSSDRPLPGTEEERDCTRWSGKLPEAGDYVIRVGPTRGNATYTLEVTIR